MHLVGTRRVVQKRPSKWVLEAPQSELDDRVGLGMADEMKRKPELADLGTLLSLLGVVASRAHPLSAIASIAANQSNKSTARGPTRSELKEAAQRQVRETWNKVEVTAVAHGVSLKQALPAAEPTTSGYE